MNNKEELFFQINQSNSKRKSRAYFKEIRKESLLYVETLIFERVEKYIKHLEETEGLDKINGI